MHNGQIHVYVEPTDGNNVVPSSVPLDSMSIAAGALSVGMGAVDAAGGSLAAVAVPILTSPALAGFGLDTLALVRSDFFHYGFLFFGLVSLVLNATNLFLGFCIKGKNRSLSAEVGQTWDAKTHAPGAGHEASREAGHDHGHAEPAAPSQAVGAPFTPRAS